MPNFEVLHDSDGSQIFCIPLKDKSEKQIGVLYVNFRGPNRESIREDREILLRSANSAQRLIGPPSDPKEEPVLDDVDKG